MAALVRTVLEDGIATLTLDRPEAFNALGPAMMADLLAALQASMCDECTRAIVLTGAGRAFSGGGDIGWFGEVLPGGPAHVRAEIERGMDTVGNPITQAIADSPVPVVAAVNGACVGGAIGIALAADVVLAARSAYFLVPQVQQLGIVPDLGATWVLARHLGRGRAMGMALLGDRIDAAEAERWGLIWRCVDDAGLLAEAQAIAVRLSRAPTVALRDARRLIDAAPTQTLARQLRDERIAQGPHVAGDFFNQACARFLKRSGRE